MRKLLKIVAGAGVVGMVLISTTIGHGWTSPTPAVFDFGDAMFPTMGLMGEGRSAVPRKGRNVTFDVDSVQERKIGVAVIEQMEGGTQEGIRYNMLPDEELHGELDALTVSLLVKFDPVPKNAVLFHRLKRSRSTPGNVQFALTSKGGDDESAEAVLQFSFVTENGGETLSATETCPVRRGEWMQLAMVYNSGEVQFYWNGEELGFAVPTFTEKIPDLGGGLGSEIGTYGFNGAVGEMVIAPQATFSTEKIRSLYKIGLSSIEGCQPTKIE